MIDLPPIPASAYQAAWDAHVYGSGVPSHAMEAAHPHIVIATLRHFADWNPDGGLDMLADEIEAELNK